jgi:hypothetical protein
MYYPTYVCRSCGEVETDYQDGHRDLYSHEMKLNTNLHKIHICQEFEGCKTIGVMEIIGFHQREK